MIPSFQDLKYLARDYGTKVGVLHQQVPIRELKPLPYREIIMEAVRDGATNAERLAAIIEQEQKEGV